MSINDFLLHLVSGQVLGGWVTSDSGGGRWQEVGLGAELCLHLSPLVSCMGTCLCLCVSVLFRR